jgi:hypothetical protein
MKTPTRLHLSKTEPQPINESSRNNDARSVAPTAVKKGRHPLYVKAGGIPDGGWGIDLNHNASQLTVKSSNKAGSMKTQHNKAQVPGLRVKTAIKAGIVKHPKDGGGRSH